MVLKEYGWLFVQQVENTNKYYTFKLIYLTYPPLGSISLIRSRDEDLANNCVRMTACLQKHF